MADENDDLRTTLENSFDQADEPLLDGQEGDVGAPAGEEAQPTSYTVPSSWKPAVREHWGKLPLEVQAEIHRREKDALIGIQQYAERAKTGDKWETALQPWAPFFRAANADPVQVIEQLLGAAYMLQYGQPEQKLQMFMQLARNYNVNLGNLSTDGYAAPQVDPNLAQLMHRMNGFEQAFYGRQNEEANMRQAQANDEVAQFRADPKNEFFNDVRETMAFFIESGLCRTLQDAYEKAVWANPDTRKVLQARQSAAKAAKARNASRSVAGAPLAPNAQANPADSLRAALENAWREHEE